MMWIVLISIFIVYLILVWFLRSLKVGNYGDKHVFITGCDSGFGRELTINLDRLGFHVFAACLTLEGRRSLSETCSSRVTTVALDVTKDESVEAALQLVKQKLPAGKGLWALVNNAGIIGPYNKFEMCSKDDFKQVLAVNLLGLAETTRKFLPLLRKAQGRLVNTSSVFGKVAITAPPYAVSKYGVEAISDIVRREVAHQGIKVAIIEPGGFRTSIMNVGLAVANAQRGYDLVSSEVRDVYGTDSVQKIASMVSTIKDSSNPSVNLIVDAYTHAITAKYPRTRYVVGSDAKYFYGFLFYLPTWLADKIIIAVIKTFEQTSSQK